LPFALQQLGDKRPVGLTVVLMGHVQERKRPKLLVGVTQHFLVDRIRSEEATLEVGQRDADGRILKDSPPPLLALT